MRVLQLNCVYDAAVRRPDVWLRACPTLTGWSDALLGAGASTLSVLQRFSVDATLTRRHVRYLFVRDDGPAWPRHRRRWDHLARAVAQETPDVVHVNGLDWPELLRPLRASLPSACALVVQDHGARPPRDPWRRLRFRRGLAAADCVLFTSRAQADPWRRAGALASAQLVAAVPESSTSVAPCDRDDARARTRTSGSPAILWVGRLTPNKDPLTVLEGFARARRRLPAATLTMLFGDDQLLTEVRACIGAEPRLRESVRLVGAVRHAAIGAWYSAADLFVLGSHHEGSGYAVIEALACGLPPVVTDIPSFRALAGSSTAGALWRPGDPAALAEALTAAWSRATDANRRATREHFLTNLSWPAVGRQAMAAYERALAARGPARDGRQPSHRDVAADLRR